MRIINKKYPKNCSIIQIIAGNKKNWIGEIIFLNAAKKRYFVLPFYNLYIFKFKKINKVFENNYAYNENNLLFDQSLKVKVEKNLSFINSIKYIKQKKNNKISEYKKLEILKNLKYSILINFSNFFFLRDNINFCKKISDYKSFINSKINSFKKSGFTLVEIKKYF